MLPAPSSGAGSIWMSDQGRDSKGAVSAAGCGFIFSLSVIMAAPIMMKTTPLHRRPETCSFRMSFAAMVVKTKLSAVMGQTKLRSAWLMR